MKTLKKKCVKCIHFNGKLMCHYHNFPTSPTYSCGNFQQVISRRILRKAECFKNTNTLKSWKLSHPSVPIIVKFGTDFVVVSARLRPPFLWLPISTTLLYAKLSNISCCLSVCVFLLSSFFLIQERSSLSLLSKVCKYLFSLDLGRST